jgi:hypothetical protein
MENTFTAVFEKGGKHSVYLNPATRKSSTVPRPSEIADPQARKICKDLGVVGPN